MTGGPLAATAVDRGLTKAEVGTFCPHPSRSGGHPQADAHRTFTEASVQDHADQDARTHCSAFQATVLCVAVRRTFDRVES